MHGNEQSPAKSHARTKIHFNSLRPASSAVRRFIGPALAGFLCLGLAGCKSPQQKMAANMESQIKKADKRDKKRSSFKKQLAAADRQIRKSAKNN